MRYWIGLLSLLPLTSLAAIYQSTDGNNHLVFSDQPSMHAQAVTLSAVTTTSLPAPTTSTTPSTPVVETQPLNIQITTPATDTKVWLGGEPLTITTTLSTLPFKATAELRYDDKILMTQAVTTTKVNFKLNYRTAGKHTVQVLLKDNSSREVLATSQLINLYVLVHRPMLQGANS